MAGNYQVQTVLSSVGPSIIEIFRSKKNIQRPAEFPEPNSASLCRERATHDQDHRAIWPNQARTGSIDVAHGTYRNKDAGGLSNVGAIARAFPAIATYVVHTRNALYHRNLDRVPKRLIQPRTDLSHSCAYCSRRTVLPQVPAPRRVVHCAFQGVGHPFSSSFAWISED